MLNKYSRVDLIFFALLALFIGMTLYELVKIIIPLYTYPRAILVFVVLCIAYVGYNFIPKSTFGFVVRESQENTSPNLLSQKISALYFLSKKYRDPMVYISFIILSTLIILSQVFDIVAITVYASLVFIVIFTYATLLGFSVPTQIKKSQFRNFNALRFFIILYAIFFVLITYMSDMFGVPEDQRFMLYFIASMLYLVSGCMIFFDYSRISSAVSRIIFQRFLRPYSVAMTILIVGLGGYLAVKNNLMDQIGEGVALVTQEEIVQENIQLPGIMSGEARLEGSEPTEGNIEYETVLVRSEYTIEPGLTLGSNGASVSSLQRVLGNLQYYLGEVDGNFGEDTRLALVDALQNECSWPDTTRGIFGPQAKQCIDNLEISRVK